MELPKNKVAIKRGRASKNYLTKRILARAARAGIQDASERTMSIMGYTVIAQNGWVVKKYADGRTEKIARIKQVNRRRKIALD